MAGSGSAAQVKDPFLSYPAQPSPNLTKISLNQNQQQLNNSSDPASPTPIDTASTPTTSQPAQPLASPIESGNDTPTDTNESINLVMTSRFEHKIGDDGQHLILTGREGPLQNCEDEPIHAPGAIQAFGVLIAFDQEPDGTLVVKQVSENSGFVIGIPARKLFGNKSFIEFLDEAEADVLLDAIDSLDERDADKDNTDLMPINFQLSGFGLAGTGIAAGAHNRGRVEWTCHAAIHRPNRDTQPMRLILELESVDDRLYPLQTDDDNPPLDPSEKEGMSSSHESEPTEEDLIASTVSIVKPLRALSRMKRRGSRARNSHPSQGDMISIMAQITDQLNKAESLEPFLKMVACIFKELADMDRVMVYQFDEAWNGRVVAEQVDWSRTKDLFRGLNFPASDIPSQARALYKLNKVRLLYDRDLPSARLCCRSIEEVETPLNMTYCHLRAMSPIHLKYLSNMGVRSSMSISITAFGDLWGLVALHTYGRFGHRVSFPVRELCKLLGDSISRNIERLSYAKRLHARKLINTAQSEENPTGYITAKAEDLLSLFDADYGVLNVGNEAKILGAIENSQELLALLEYLRLKQFTSMRSSQSIHDDFPDIEFVGGFKRIAGLLYVPLSSEGRDFIFFIRRGQLQEVHWAGNPYTNKLEGDNFQPLEPRKSFKSWSEVVLGKSRTWTDEQMETAGVLCLVYGKFIAVWREKETALAANQLTNLLLANASHEVRTPLNAIINYLELALDGPIEGELRENLSRSHAASRSLIHVINDLLDLTRTETNGELYSTDPFNLPETIEDALAVHKAEAERVGLEMVIVEVPTGTPPVVVGDRARIRQLIGAIAANAVKHTKEGGIHVEWGEVADTTDAAIEDGMENKQNSIRINISVSDTGSGISDARLESIFRELEQVSTVGDDDQNGDAPTAAVGLGLATVARIVRTLGGQLRVESTVGVGSKFSLLVPFRLPGKDELQLRKQNDAIEHAGSLAGSGLGSGQGSGVDSGGTSVSSRTVGFAARPNVQPTSRSNDGSAGSSSKSAKSDIDSLINAMSVSHMDQNWGARTRTGSGSGGGSGGTNSNTASVAYSSTGSAQSSHAAHHQRGGGARSLIRSNSSGSGGEVIEGSNVNLRAVKMDPAVDSPPASINPQAITIGNKTAILPEGRNTIRPAKQIPMVKSPDAEEYKPAQTPASLKHNKLAAVTPPAQATETKHSPNHMSAYVKQPTPVKEGSKTPLRILIVEDEMINRHIISARLKKDGHQTVCCEHGGVAVRKFQADPNFDLVLMDLQMPVMNGYDATREIRKLEASSKPASPHPSVLLNGGRIPILAVTASLAERDRQAIADAGLDGWALKPVDFKRLDLLIRGCVDRKRRSEDVYSPGHWERGGWLEEAPGIETMKTRMDRMNTGSAVEPGP